MIIRLIIFLCLLAPLSAQADEASDVAAFNTVYGEYLDLVNTSKDLDAAIISAEKVYKLAPRIYSKKSFEYAVITYNLANLHDEKGSIFENENEKRALKLYRDYFKIIDKLKIPQDLDYIDKYFAYTTTAHNIDSDNVSKRHEKKLIKIAKNLNLADETKAALNFKLGKLKIRSQPSKNAAKYFNSAHKLYLSAHGPDHLKVADALFWLGIIQTSKENDENANKYYLETLRIYELNLKDDTDLPISTHVFLVNLYETVGKTEEATKHVLATAVPDSDDTRYIRPLYQAPLVMPKDIPNEIESYKVVLNFTVDKAGHTKNIIVTETDDVLFNENSIASLKKFRFTPTIKNDQLIEKNDVSLTMNYYTLSRYLPPRRLFDPSSVWFQ
ncbi:MAG: energy transducer TonB [Emcibacteraceae bacterium]|nr:energy transducer TonB [Emcibacteraceae bacterium]